MFGESENYKCVELKGSEIEQYKNDVQKATNELFDISFLKKINPNKIKSISKSCNCLDYEILYHFIELEEVLLTPINYLYDNITTNQTLDLLKFPKLKGLSTSDISLYENIDKVKLTHLDPSGSKIDWDIINKITSLQHLYLYEAKGFCLDKIPNLTNLKEINVRLTDIHNFDGIERYQDLESIVLFYAKKFDSIKGVSKLPKLKQVFMSNLPKLMDVSEFGQCKNLEILELETLKNADCSTLASNSIVRLSMNKCKEVESLRFINNMITLKELVFLDTNVVDGDITPCMKLDWVGTMDKRHYNIKSKDLPKKKITIGPMGTAINNEKQTEKYEPPYEINFD